MKAHPRKTAAARNTPQNQCNLWLSSFQNLWSSPLSGEIFDEFQPYHNHSLSTSGVGFHGPSHPEISCSTHSSNWRMPFHP